ncbi:MAG: RnfABCDGE type electron transport complex subunit B [Succinivibrio sp.]|nr:RnfABCDGE type electron transport complex subunit B [Succinivibrio sp.]
MMTDLQLTLLLWVGSILFVLGTLLAVLRSFTDSKISSDQKRLENVLPNMNCGQCGYPSCSAYAQALINEEVPCNLCHPGGPEISKNIATVLGRQVPASVDFDSSLFMPRKVAYIHGSECNGCDKCKRHCQVDAIEGGIKAVHYIDNQYCIGCGDCVESCPQKCIEMIRLPQTIEHYDWQIKAKHLSAGVK